MARYIKLESGAWGISAKPGYAAGAVVNVTKKSGETKRETIAACLRTASENAIYSIAASKPRNWPGKMCPGCGSEPLDDDLSCWECGYSGRE